MFVTLKYILDLGLHYWFFQLHFVYVPESKPFNKVPNVIHQKDSCF